MTQKKANKTPIAVLISDVHFTPSTLEVATQAYNTALDKAEELGVPLIDCGDIMDTKAIMRGECVNRLIDIFKTANRKGVECILLNGNHTLINEKGIEHTLNFLDPYCTVVDTYDHDGRNDLYFTPYFNDTTKLLNIVKDRIPKGSTIIMHQGVQGANMGHYIQDKTSLPKEVFKDYRIISGHYHRAQNIECGPIKPGNVGLFSYVGNPYTLSFGEANDGPKGFQVLYSDGSLELIPTNLRKHVVLNWKIIEDPEDGVLFERELPFKAINKDDLVWLKIEGFKSLFDRIDKLHIASILGINSFKLDLIPIDNDQPAAVEASKPNNEGEILDILIDKLAETGDHKKYLKDLWREIM